MRFSGVLWEEIDHERIQEDLVALKAAIGERIMSLRLVTDFPIRNNAIPEPLSSGLQEHADQWLKKAYSVHCDASSLWNSEDFPATVWASMESFLNGPVKELLAVALERALDAGYCLDTGQELDSLEYLFAKNLDMDDRYANAARVCAEGSTRILANLASRWKERLTGIIPAPTPLTAGESALLRYHQNRGDIPKAAPQEPKVSFELPGPTRAEIRTPDTQPLFTLDDRRFALMAIEEARKSIAEDERAHPKVGAVVVKSGIVLSTAHRGEIPQCHAEFVALEKKLPDDSLAGATVYTTLEPCTTRKHPKIPCAQRLAERKVARVVIGMLDPNHQIRGLGDQLLSDANIEIQMFPRDLRSEVEEMNRDFIRAQRQRQTIEGATQKQDSAVNLATAASRLLCDATRDLQKAVWSFYALHTQCGIARDLGDQEQQILEKIGAALRVFTQDYDLPADVNAAVTAEIGNISITLANLKAFSMTGQGNDMQVAATQIQDTCQRIRAAAKPYAYRVAR